MHSIFEILEESTDPSAVDLISLEDLKLALGITTDTDDEALQAAITFQSRIIAEYLDRRLAFAEAMETFTFDHNETMLTRQALTLSLYPVAQIFEVSSAGATAADYEFDPTSGRLWTEGSWSDVIAVAYSGGYMLPEDSPARLQQAVIMAVDRRRRGARDPALRAVQHGDTRIDYFSPVTAQESFLPAPVIELIKPYRKMHVA